jgi:hypothetical protein
MAEAYATDILCNGGTSEVTVIATGGTAPYQGEGLYTEVAGTYTYYVTDANGCSAFTITTITQPDELLLSYVATDPSCYGCSDGGIDITLTGGVAPYIYYWSNGETTEDISNLTAGTYTVYVTDANGCTVEESVTITQPSAPLLLDYTAINTTCFNGNNGSIDLTVTGGVMPYTYAWSNNETTEDISSLTAGLYHVVVTDYEGSSAEINIIISEPSQIVVSFEVINVTCYGYSDGAADMTVSGGAAPYNYYWSNGATTEDISGLTAGTYFVTITDVNNCVVTEALSIYGATIPMNAWYETTPATCNPTGTIDIFISGGISPYSFNWSNGETDEDLTGVSTGLYIVTITDSYGCVLVVEGIFVEEDLMTYVITHTTLTCYGDADAEASITVSGGSLPYTFLWSNGSTDETITNLSAGTYTVTVSDATGCLIIQSVVITNPPQLIIDAFETYTTSGAPLGAAVQVISGGTAPFTYLWSNGMPFQGIRHLTNGVTYCVTVTDANGCYAVDCVTYVTTPPSIAEYINNNSSENPGEVPAPVINNIDDLNNVISANIYPNPNIGGKFWIELSLNDYNKLMIDVIDETGRVIYNKLVMEKLDTAIYIELSNVRAGAYYVRIQTDKYGIITKRIIVAGN